MQFNATARQCGDYCNLIFLICFSFSFLSVFETVFSSMNVSRNKNHNDFRASIFNHFLCCMLCCCFSFVASYFFFPFMWGEGRKILFLVVFFCIFFWSQFTKNTYTLNHVPILRLWNFFTFFHFSLLVFENSLLDRFFYILFLIAVCVNIIRKYWKNSLNFDLSLEIWRSKVADSLRFCQQLNMCARKITIATPRLRFPLKDLWIFSYSTLYWARDTFVSNEWRSYTKNKRSHKTFLSSLMFYFPIHSS